MAVAVKYTASSIQTKTGSSNHEDTKNTKTGIIFALCFFVSFVLLSMKVFADRANSWTADVPVRSGCAWRGLWETSTTSELARPLRTGTSAVRFGCGCAALAISRFQLLFLG